MYGRTKTKWRPKLETLEDRLAPATHTWTGLATGNPNWTVASNWQNNSPPTTDGNAMLVFPPGGLQKSTTFNNFAPGTTFKSIALQSSYDIKGNRLRLGSGGLTTTTGDCTFQADVEIPSGTLTISVPSGSLQIGGSAGGTISGAGGFSKIGGNTLKLGRANTFSGAVSIGDGTVTLLHSGALGFTAGNTTVENGGTLQLEGGITVNEPLVLKGQGNVGFGALRNATGNNTVAGTVNLAALNPRFHVSAGTTLTVSGVISGVNAVGLTKSSTGKLILNAANTYAGPTVVMAGVLNLRHNSALGSTASGTTVNNGGTLQLEGNLTLNEPLVLNGNGASGLGALHAVIGANNWSGNISLNTSSAIRSDSVVDFEISGVISGAATALLGKDGPGELVLAGANTYDGDLTINSGTVIARNFVTGAGSLGSADGKTTVSDGATLQLESSTSDALNLARGGVSGEGALLSSATGVVFVHGEVSVNSIAEISVLSGSLSLTDRVLGGIGASLRKSGPGTLYLNASILSDVQLLSGGLFCADPVFGDVEILSGTMTSGAHISGTVFVGKHATLTAAHSVGSITVNPLGTLEVLSLLTVTGSVDLKPDSTLRLRLDSPSSGQYSALRLTGGVANAAFNDANFEIDLDFTPAPGTQFQIIENLTDGSTSTGPVIIDGVKVFQGGSFPLDASYVLNFTAGSGNDVVITKNSGTAAADLQIAPRVISEGEETVLSGRLTDPNPEDQLTLVVDWRDGSPIETYRNLGTDPFAIPHKYLNQGRYPVRATWFDNHGEGNSRDVFVTVLNVAPVLTNLAVTTPVVVNQFAILGGNIYDPGPQDVLTIVVNWGDGHEETFYYAPNTPGFAETHAYETPGTYSIEVTLHDDVDLTTGIVDVVVLPGTAPGNGGRSARVIQGRGNLTYLLTGIPDGDKSINKLNKRRLLGGRR